MTGEPDRNVLAAWLASPHNGTNALGGGVAVATAAKGDRAVWTGGEVDLFGTVSSDGRFLTHTDWNLTNSVLS